MNQQPGIPLLGSASDRRALTEDAVASPRAFVTASPLMPEVEDLGGRVLGFRLPEEVAGGEGSEAEASAKAAKSRRKAASG